jgi:hypothetical protein
MQREFKLKISIFALQYKGTAISEWKEDIPRTTRMKSKHYRKKYASKN